MELYFSPLACSLAAHILVLETGADVRLRRVALREKKIVHNDSDFWDVAPKGKVPALVLDCGTTLTENVAVLTFLADLKPELELAPAPGQDDRYLFLQWLSYVGSELHKGIFYPIFWFDEHHASSARKLAPERLSYLEDYFSTNDFLIGNSFTAADAYLFWWFVLAPRAGIDLTKHAAISAFYERCLERPAVRTALTNEQGMLQT